MKPSYYKYHLFQCTYQYLVDLYLMHWPLAFRRTENYDILTGKNGKVREKGSNLFTVKMLTRVAFLADN